ncbi:MAG: three component ABC system middle component [Bacilli bacterium]
MSKLAEEVKVWNTPILGAFLLWRFTQGYSKEHPRGDAPIALLHFVAAAILTNKDLLNLISNKRDNLQSYVRGFENSKQSDILLSIQQRTRDKRTYTLAAIDIALKEGILTWDTESGKLYPHDILNKPSRGRGLREGIRRDGEKAEILGRWFSKHDVPTIAAYLKVVF